MTPKQTLGYFLSQQPLMLADLLELVQIESPTTSKEAVDILGQNIAGRLADLGMQIEWNEQSVRGNHLIGRWIHPNAPKILMIGHIDTVWELGIFERMPIKVEGNVASGPGIFDMKGGIVTTIYALKLLLEQGLSHCNLSFLLNTDEEEGSETSRALIEREAKDAETVFILEPAGPNNSLKTKRRGTGHYVVQAHGKSAHAGVEPEKGINAIQELAEQVLRLQSWNQLRSGISVNVGIIRGGTRTNVVPDLAQAEIDLRSDSADDVRWLEEQFQSLKPVNPNARLEIRGGFDRPPFVRSEKVLSLYREAVEIATSFDYPVTEFWTGGASDGNFTAAMGIATLDGLGPEGAGAHALHEHILVSSLPRRANLLYHLLRNRIIRESER